MTEEETEAYKNKVFVAIHSAVTEASRQEDGRPVIVAAPAFEALLATAALVVAQNPAFEQQRELRVFCEGAQLKLREYIRAIRADPQQLSPFGPPIPPESLGG